MLGPFWGKEGKAGALDLGLSGLTEEKSSAFPPMGGRCQGLKSLLTHNSSWGNCSSRFWRLDMKRHCVEINSDVLEPMLKDHCEGHL